MLVINYNNYDLTWGGRAITTECTSGRGARPHPPSHYPDQTERGWNSEEFMQVKYAIGDMEIETIIG